MRCGWVNGLGWPRYRGGTVFGFKPPGFTEIFLLGHQTHPTDSNTTQTVKTLVPMMLNLFMWQHEYNTHILYILFYIVNSNPLFIIQWLMEVMMCLQVSKRSEVFLLNLSFKCTIKYLIIKSQQTFNSSNTEYKTTSTDIKPPSTSKKPGLSLIQILVLSLILETYLRMLFIFYVWWCYPSLLYAELTCFSGSTNFFALLTLC